MTHDRKDVFYVIRESNMNGTTHGPILDAFFIEREHTRNDAHKKMSEMGYSPMGHSAVPHTKDGWEKKYSSLIREIQFFDIAKDKW